LDKGTIKLLLLLQFYFIVLFPVLWVKDFFITTKRRKKMKTNKNLFKALITLGILLVISAALLVTYLHFKPQGISGSKKIAVEVSIPEEKSKEFTIHTDAEFLRQALEDAKLVKGTESSYGLFITEVNGRKADDTKKEWWCITKDKATVNTGVDDTPIADGDHFEITLKTGY
jgi:hypothetical protein